MKEDLSKFVQFLESGAVSPQFYAYFQELSAETLQKGRIELVLASVFTLIIVTIIALVCAREKQASIKLRVAAFLFFSFFAAIIFYDFATVLFAPKLYVMRQITGG